MCTGSNGKEGIKLKEAQEEAEKAKNVDKENYAAAAIKAHEANEDANEAQDVHEEAKEADVNEEAKKAQEGFNSPCFEEHVQAKLDT